MSGFKHDEDELIYLSNDLNYLAIFIYVYLIQIITLYIFTDSLFNDSLFYYSVCFPVLFSFLYFCFVYLKNISFEKNKIKRNNDLLNINVKRFMIGRYDNEEFSDLDSFKKAYDEELETKNESLKIYTINNISEHYYNLWNEDYLKVLSNEQVENQFNQIMETFTLNDRT